MAIKYQEINQFKVTETQQMEKVKAVEVQREGPARAREGNV